MHERNETSLSQVAIASVVHRGRADANEKQTGRRFSHRWSLIEILLWGLLVQLLCELRSSGVLTIVRLHLRLLTIARLVFLEWPKSVLVLGHSDHEMPHTKNNEKTITNLFEFKILNTNKLLKGLSNFQPKQHCYFLKSEVTFLLFVNLSLNFKKMIQIDVLKECLPYHLRKWTCKEFLFAVFCQKLCRRRGRRFELFLPPTPFFLFANSLSQSLQTQLLIVIAKLSLITDAFLFSTIKTCRQLKTCSVFPSTLFDNVC